MKKQKEINLGFSLIEMLVVITIFGILTIVSTQAITSSLRGAKKSESLGEVRENVEYALNTIERQLRNAQSCTPGTSFSLQFVDENGAARSFNCLNGLNGYLALGATRLTSSKVNINCQTTPVFTCSAIVPNVPQSVTITLKGTYAAVQGAEGATITETTRVLLRTY